MRLSSICECVLLDVIDKEKIRNPFRCGVGARGLRFWSIRAKMRGYGHGCSFSAVPSTGRCHPSRSDVIPARSSACRLSLFASQHNNESPDTLLFQLRSQSRKIQVSPTSCAFKHDLYNFLILKWMPRATKLYFISGTRILKLTSRTTKSKGRGCRRLDDLGSDFGASLLSSGSANDRLLPVLTHQSKICRIGHRRRIHSLAHGSVTGIPVETVLSALLLSGSSLAI